MGRSSTNIKVRHLFLLGFGGVGRALARQVLAARRLHETRNGLWLKVAGIADSAGTYVEQNGIGSERLAEMLERKTATGRLGVQQSPIAGTDLYAMLPAGTIVVDTTATDQTVPVLLPVVRREGGIVLANKLPLAGDLAWFDDIARGYTRWETTVGAALPVVSTLNTLLDSGDEVQRIEGSLSGTLGFIAAQLEAGVRLGDAVRDAKRRGYTEPDPRQDLGGLDAARKALILARMMGYRLHMNDVQVESLYPPEMNALTVEDFLREVDGLNATMAARAADLTRGGRKLRYTAVVENGQCTVGLTGADPASKLGSIRASDSIVVFTTKHYSDNPLAVSGRGAGQEVTASGVLGDIISLSREMG
ncbi:MAG: homoserine dehydrogenase [Chloroflexi bacterium]|nr:homoserine dehydrogenase [Chloroflexota bacterium]